MKVWMEVGSVDEVAEPVVSPDSSMVQAPRSKARKNRRGIGKKNKEKSRKRKIRLKKKARKKKPSIFALQVCFPLSSLIFFLHS
jgi:hypothetical protein